MTRQQAGRLGKKSERSAIIHRTFRKEIPEGRTGIRLYPKWSARWRAATKYERALLAEVAALERHNAILIGYLNACNNATVAPTRELKRIADALDLALFGLMQEKSNEGKKAHDARSH